MENQKQYPMTQEGFEKLERELEELKTVKRPEVVEKIKVARSEFSDKSPKERATLIFSTTSGRFTVFNSSSSRSNFSNPSCVIGYCF